MALRVDGPQTLTCAGTDGFSEAISARLYGALVLRQSIGSADENGSGIASTKYRNRSAGDPDRS